MDRRRQERRNGKFANERRKRMDIRTALEGMFKNFREFPIVPGTYFKDLAEGLQRVIRAYLMEAYHKGSLTNGAQSPFTFTVKDLDDAYYKGLRTAANLLCPECREDTPYSAFGKHAVRDCRAQAIRDVLRAHGR